MKSTFRILTSLLIGVALLSLSITLLPVYADGSVNGVATRCSNGIASCSYSLTDADGTGSASTNAFVGGYVGQSPLPFTGGSVTFQLPGEAQATYAPGAYNGEAVLDGTSPTAGTLYQTNGTFWATDVNTGLVVVGTTSTIVGIKGHSGRGGGDSYTLVSGTISINPILSPLVTSLVLNCDPSSTPVDFQSTCTVTVTDTDTSAPVPPTGSVALTSSGAGTFSANSCSLVGSGLTATCQVSYTSSPGSEGQQSITANYVGDSVHLGSSASFMLTVGKRSVSTALACTAPFNVGKPTTCMVTVADTSPGTLINPSGTATFSSNRKGSFSSTVCHITENNDVSSCSVKFTPGKVGLYTLTVKYSGDSDHNASATSMTFKVA